MEPQRIRVGDFSPINGGMVEGSEYTHLISIHVQTTACGKYPKNIFMGYDFFLDCPDCLAEIQYRHDNPEAKNDEFGHTHVEIAKE